MADRSQDPRLAYSTLDCEVRHEVAKIKGSGGLTSKDSSAGDRAREVEYAYSWFNNITRDAFGG